MLNNSTTNESSKNAKICDENYEFMVIIWVLIALANIVRDPNGTRVLPHHYFHITTQL